MRFHENRLLADDSHVISYLSFFSKMGANVTKFVVCCSRDCRFKGLCMNTISNFRQISISRIGWRGRDKWLSSCCGDRLWRQCLCHQTRLMGTPLSLGSPWRSWSSSWRSRELRVTRWSCPNMGVSTNSARNYILQLMKVCEHAKTSQILQQFLSQM